MSVFVFVPDVGANGPEPVRINEIMYNPAGSDSGREWIELYNDAAYDINISGWKLFESSSNHGLTYISGSRNLEQKGYAVICSDPTKFLIDYPGFSGTLYDSAFSLTNSGEYLAIKNDSLVITDEVTYVPMSGADDTGMSLEYDDSGVWYPSFVYGGTPGAVNSQLSPMGISKTVWDGASWVDMVTVSLGETVWFNITISNIGSDFYILYNMMVLDVLPQNLLYTGNATLNGVVRPPDTVSGSDVLWDIPVTEFFIDPGMSAYIEFSAEVVGSGMGVNLVNVTSEYCDPDIDFVYGEDTATVDVLVSQYVVVEKTVKGVGTGFGNEITVPLYSMVMFNVTIDSMGQNVMQLEVVDELPGGLSYVLNSATVNGVPQEPVIQGNTLTWVVTDVPGDSQVIVLFDASVNQLGTHLNLVNISLYNQQITLYDEDSAMVICSNLVLNKRIWNDNSETWEEQGVAPMGSTVRFNLSLGYYGPSVIVYINISDVLPDFMAYAGNASLPETGFDPISNTVWWYILALLPGTMVYIEFDAMILQTGSLINHGMVWARECGNPTPLTSYDNLTILVGTELTCDAGGPYSGDVAEQIHIIGSATGGYPPYQYLWDLDDDGTYDDATGQHINTSWSMPGTYNIALKVVDAQTQTAYDTATVVITSQGLICDAGGPYYGEINETISITGTATGGLEPYNFSWDLNNNGSYEDAYGAEISNSWKESGEYLIGLRVKDADLAEVFDSATIYIYGDELHADAGGPYNGMINISLALTGSATGGQTPYEFSWDLDNDSIFDDATGANTTWSWNQTGLYQISLQAIDASANISIDTTTVTITSEKLIANAGGPYEGSVNSPIEINGTATGGVSPYSFHWELNNDSSYDDKIGANITNIWNTHGEYPISVLVIDDVGNEAFDNTTVTIVGASVQITKPEPNTIYLWNIPLPLIPISLIIGPITVTVHIESDVTCNLSIAINDQEIYSETDLIGSKDREVRYNNMCFGMRRITAKVTDAYGMESEEAVSVLIFIFRPGIL